MTRYGARFGPDIALLGVPEVEAERVCLEAPSGRDLTEVGISHDPAGLLLDGR